MTDSDVYSSVLWRRLLDSKFTCCHKCIVKSSSTDILRFRISNKSKTNEFLIHTLNIVNIMFYFKICLCLLMILCFMVM